MVNVKWVLCLSGFLDLFAVALFFPLLVHQAKDLGASPSQVGLFASVYGSVQLFTSPLIGELSDRVGRKTVLLISLLGTGLSYLLHGMCTNLLALSIARVVSGIFKHGQSMNRLCLLDSCSKEEVSQACGMYYSISGVGFIIGPTLGGILASYDNGFFKVSLLSSLLFLINFALVYFCVPAKKNNHKKKEGNLLSAFNFFKGAHQVPWTKVGDVFTVRFLQSFAMILYRSNFTVILIYRFSVEKTTTGYIQSFNGLISALTGFSTGRVIPAFSSVVRCHNVFSAMFIISLLGVTIGPSINFITVMFIPLCYSSCVLRVTGASLLYHRSTADTRGLVDGLGNTLTSFARALGPAIGGYAQEWSIFGPGLCGVFLAVTGTLVSVYSETKLYKQHVE